MDQPEQSAMQSVVAGLCAAGIGALITVLTALGAIPAAQNGTPRWVVACAGVMFILIGAALIVGHALAGGAGDDGDLPAGTPVRTRLIQYVLGAGGIGCLAAIFGWIAFGSGPRDFTITLPFLGMRPAQGEIVGRTLFGIAAALAVVLLIAVTVRTVRRIRTPASPRRPPANAG
jgi:hypothetical protein